MPNFIAANLKDTPYPFGEKNVSFIWSADDESESLVYTKSNESEFFLTVKKRENDYVIKGEKITRPASLGLLQSALVCYRDLNTSNIKSEAIAIKNDKQLEKKEYIFNDKEFLEYLRTSKFKKIYIEIGFGSGRHLLYQAKENLGVLIVGIEVYKPCVEQVNNLAASLNLKNVILLNLDARLVLSLIGSNLVDKVFLHFPIPWEKSEKRRVVSASFASEVQRILKVSGKFELRSDDRGYSDFTISHFLNLDDSQIQIYKNRFLEVSSKYEDRWIRQNKDIYDVIFTNSVNSKMQNLDGDFEFGSVDESFVLSKFKNTIFKEDNYFVHIERLYKKKSGGVLIRVAFGSFYRPEHCYILVENDFADYFIKKPLLTPENLKAHQKIREYLTCKTL